jgi:hypothetical protein
MKNKSAFFKAIALVAIVFSDVGCGGGTGGSSSTSGVINKILQGEIRSDAGTPISSAKVTLLNSGQETSTNSQGIFELATESTASESLELEVSQENNTARFTVNSNTIDPSLLVLKLTLNKNNIITEQNLELLPLVVGGGDCEGAFEKPKTLNFAANNNPLIIINQIASLAPETLCTIQFDILSSGLRTAAVQFELYAAISNETCSSSIQSLNCSRLVAEGISSSTSPSSISFKLLDNPDEQYYVLEIPGNATRANRVGFVINPRI